MLKQKARAHGAMEHISFVLWIAVFAVFGFPQASSSAARDDLIEAAKRERELVFYTTINLEEAGTVSRHFKAKYPFLEVSINRADGERVVTKVLQETRAKKYLVDVIQTPAFYLHVFKKRGILGEYASTEDRFYPRNFKEEKYWTTTYYNPYVTPVRLFEKAKGNPLIYRETNRQYKLKSAQ